MLCAAWVAGDVYAAGRLLCSRPAPLEGEANPDAPDYIVKLKSEVKEPAREASRLAKRYGLRGFDYLESMRLLLRVTLTPSSLAALRCEPAVEYVAHNQKTGFPGETDRPVPDPSPPLTQPSQ
jgi:hypothetical protein